MSRQPSAAERRQWRNKQALAIAAAYLQGAIDTKVALENVDSRQAFRNAFRITEETAKKVSIIRSQPPPWVERIVTLTQRHYNFMLVGGFEVLMAKRNEYDAYQTYIETVRDYWMTKSKLKHAVGGRLPDPSESTPTAFLTPPSADAPSRATSPAKAANR